MEVCGIAGGRCSLRFGNSLGVAKDLSDCAGSSFPRPITSLTTGTMDNLFGRSKTYKEFVIDPANNFKSMKIRSVA